jgi:cytochrome P450
MRTRVGGEAFVKVDLLDPSKYDGGHPWGELRWLRENDPVHWHEEHDGGPGFWAVTEYKNVKMVEIDHKRFTSSPVTTISDGGAVAPDDDHYHLIFTDPPRHTVHRKFLLPEFSPIAVRKLAGHIDEVVDDILDEVIERGGCDLVPDVAGKLASYVIADLLGLPRPLAVELYKATDVITSGKDLDDGEGLQARLKLFGCASEVYADRHASPREDMLTRLAHGVVDGCPVDSTQFAIDFLLLVVAGGDTTRNAVAGGVEQLFIHPDQWAQLADADDKVIDSAVEEFLRWTTPIPHLRRLATADTTINDQPIEKGQKVVVFYAAANRDPSMFKDPDTFDIMRSPNAHIAFGAGPHFCLGSHLARLEMRAMLKGLVRRLPDLQPAGPSTWLDGSTEVGMVGPKSLPVRFTPGPKARP